MLILNRLSKYTNCCMFVLSSFLISTHSYGMNLSDEDEISKQSIAKAYTDLGISEEDSQELNPQASKNLQMQVAAETEEILQAEINRVLEANLPAPQGYELDSPQGISFPPVQIQTAEDIERTENETASSSSGQKDGVFDLSSPTSGTFSGKKDFDVWGDVLGKNPKSHAALSLDGGGIRGLMEAIWIQKLETHTNRKCHEIFKFIGGTSTGGILSLALTTPNEAGNAPVLSTDELINLFEHDGKIIFPKYNGNIFKKVFLKIWGKVRGIMYASYDAQPLTDYLQDYLKDKTLGESLSGVEVLVTSAEANTQKPFLFSTSDNAVKGVKRWQIGRSTSAAPTFFPSYSFTLPGQTQEVRLVDGGLYRNNPSALVATEAFKWGRSQNLTILPANLVMVSFGTGKPHPDNLLPINGGLLNSARPVIDTLMNSCSEGVHETMQGIFPETNYLRVNPQLEFTIELDQTENLQHLRTLAEEQEDEIVKFYDASHLRKIVEAHDSSKAIN